MLKDLAEIYKSGKWDGGLQLETYHLFFNKNGLTLALHQIAGSFPVSRDLSMINLKMGMGWGAAMSSFNFINKTGLSMFDPASLPGLRFPSNLRMSFVDMFVLDKTGIELRCSCGIAPGSNQVLKLYLAEPSKTKWWLSGIGLKLSLVDVSLTYRVSDYFAVIFELWGSMLVLSCVFQEGNNLE